MCLSVTKNGTAFNKNVITVSSLQTFPCVKIFSHAHYADAIFHVMSQKLIN